MFPKPMVIAEIGCTHIKNLDRAFELIRLAKLANADVVKFQKRNPYESVPKNLWDQPHPNQIFAYGKTYLEHRLNLEFDITEHKTLQNYCNKTGIMYSTSVWDMTSTRQVIGLRPPFIKIPSACNQNKEMLEFILNSDYRGDIHLSLGLLSIKEKNDLIEYLKPFSDRLVIYHCTSKYPCPFEDLNLLEIENLKKHFPRVGFSNHGYGIAADVAAYVLGATYIERHFIDDRTFRHTDAAASLEPDGLRRLCRDLENIRQALTLRHTDLDQEEVKQRDKLKITNSHIQ